MPLSLSLPLSARRYTGYEAMPFFEGLLPEDDVREAVARRSMCRPCDLWNSFACSARIVPGDVVILEEGDSCDLPGEAAYVPLPNTLEEIVRYPYGAIAQLRAEYRLSLAGGQEKIALFMTIVLLWTRGWFAAIGGSTVEPYHQASDSRSFSASGLQRIYLHGSSAGYGVRSSRDVLS